MKFVKLDINNFMSYESHSFVFGGTGLTLIAGENGAGKSAQWDAISWCVFGQTVRGLKGDDIVRRGHGDCAVHLEIELGDSKYRISRYRSHKKFGNRLVVVVEGPSGTTTHELGTLALTQEWLIKTLGIDFDLFRCTVVFAQEEVFNFVNATNKEQKEILSKIMRVDFTALLKQAKEELRFCDEQLQSLLKRQAILTSHQKSDEDLDALYGEKSRQFESDKAAEIEAMSEELSGIEAEIAECEEADPSELVELKAKISSRITVLKEKRQEVENEIRGAEMAITMAKKRIVENKSLMAKGVCPTCRQKVGGAYHGHENEKWESDITTQSAVLEECSKKMKPVREQITKFEEYLTDTVRRIAEQEATNRHLRGLVSQKAALASRIRKKQAEANPYLAMLIEEKSKQKEIILKLSEVEEAIESGKGLRQYLEFWVSAYGDSGIKSFIFDLVCSTLTVKANKYVDVLTDGQVTIEFDTQSETKSGETREKFDVAVIIDGKRVPYASYSGGEKRRISLAVDMALADLMMDYAKTSFNIVVLDEQTSYMNKEGRVSFFRLLKEMAKSRHVFVVDHDAEFKALFDDVIMVKKVGGKSVVS